MRQQRVRVIVAIAVAMCLMACAGLQVPDTPKGKYLVARTAVNDTYENYLNALEMQTVEVQKDWDDKTEKLWTTTNEALAAWLDVINEQAEDPTMTAEKAERIYKKAKVRLFNVLADFGVETEE